MKGWHRQTREHSKAAVKGWRKRPKRFFHKPTETSERTKILNAISYDKLVKARERYDNKELDWDAYQLIVHQINKDRESKRKLPNFFRFDDDRETKIKSKLPIPNEYTKIKDGKKVITGVLTKLEFDKYKKIAEDAREKGYAIPRIDLKDGPLVVDEINIPEDFATDAFFIPDITKDSGKDVSLVLIDDDLNPKFKNFVFAHELGHVHMDQVKERDSEDKADAIGADINGLNFEEILKLEEEQNKLEKSHKMKGRK